MNDYMVMDLLAKSFTYGKTEKLSHYLTTDCVFISEYENIKRVTSEETLNMINTISSKVRNPNKHSYEIILLEDVLRDPAVVKDVDGCYLNSYGILLNQLSSEFPSVLVSVMQERKNGKIKKIVLSLQRELVDAGLCEYEDNRNSKANTPNETRKLIANLRKRSPCKRSCNEWNSQRNWVLRRKWKRIYESKPINETILVNSWCIKRKDNSRRSRVSLICN